MTTPRSINPIRDFLPPLALFALVVGLWRLAVTVWDLPPFLVPSPSAVLSGAMENAGALFSAASLTAIAALCGLTASMIFGTLTAFVFSQSTLIRRGLYPYAIFLQTVPIVAVAPLIIIWFGTGFQSVVIVAFIISVFPVITNATEGLTRVDPDLKDLFRLCGAGRLQTLIKLNLPHAAPYLVAGAKIASGLAVIGAIVGEFFAGYGSEIYGLGYIIILTSGQLDTPYLFSAILASTGLGLLFFGGISFVGGRILKRWG